MAANRKGSTNVGLIKAICREQPELTPGEDGRVELSGQLCKLSGNALWRWLCEAGLPVSRATAFRAKYKGFFFPGYQKAASEKVTKASARFLNPEELRELELEALIEEQRRDAMGLEARGQVQRFSARFSSIDQGEFDLEDCLEPRWSPDTVARMTWRSKTPLEILIEQESYEQVMIRARKLGSQHADFLQACIEGAELSDLVRPNNWRVAHNTLRVLLSELCGVELFRRDGDNIELSEVARKMEVHDLHRALRAAGFEVSLQTASESQKTGWFMEETGIGLSKNQARGKEVLGYVLLTPQERKKKTAMVSRYFGGLGLSVARQAKRQGWFEVNIRNLDRLLICEEWLIDTLPQTDTQEG